MKTIKELEVARLTKSAKDVFEYKTQMEELKSANAALRAALTDAALSLECIARDAGVTEELIFKLQIRGYANSRAIQARAALAKEVTQ